MSVVRGDYHGEQVTHYREWAGLRYCTDEELQRARSLEMMKLKAMGLPTIKIAKKYRVTPRYVNMLIKMARDAGASRLACA